MNLPDGTFLQHKKYQLTRMIGQGGFGITYLGVWNTEVKGGLGTMKTTVPVCIKEYFFKDYCYREKNSYAVKVHSETGEKLFSKFKEKLIKEANILSEVHHPHIVNVLEVFEENNTAYIIMEYITGCSLKYMLEKEGVLPENKVLKYTHEIGNALDFVHNKNIVHLDIKPGNILIDRKGNARLIDFGVSKRYDIEEQETSTTTLTLSKGFASIEQYDDEGTLAFSPCPDIYSLGATMYNLLTSVVPVESILRATKTMLPPSAYNSNITPETEKAILKAMEIKPEDRFQTVKEFLAGLDIPPYELTENRLTETNASDEDDRTEVLGAHVSNHPDDEDDRTIVTSAAGREVTSGKTAGSQTKRKAGLLVAVVLFAFVGYAVYHYFSDVTSAQGTLTGIDMPGDSLQPDFRATYVEGRLDSHRNPLESQTDNQQSDSIQSGNQTGTGQQQAGVSGTAGQQTAALSQSAHTSTAADNTRVSNVPPETASAQGDVGLPVTYTAEELAAFDKQYQSLISAAKLKMEPPVRNYSGALENLTEALSIVETTGIRSSSGSNYFTEVNTFIQTCKEKIEEKERKERLANYVIFHEYGDFKLVRNKKTNLFGAIDASGKEHIPCIYITINRVSNGPPEFQREDGLVDIYNEDGSVKGTGVLPSNR